MKSGYLLDLCSDYVSSQKFLISAYGDMIGLKLLTTEQLEILDEYNEQFF